MIRDFSSTTPEVQVLPAAMSIRTAEAPPVAVFVPVSRPQAVPPLVLAVSFTFLFAALAAFGWFLVQAQERQAVLRERIAALDAARTAEARAARHSVALLERQVAAQTSEIVSLEEGRRALSEALAAQAALAARNSRRPVRTTVTAQPAGSLSETPVPAPSAEGQTSEDPEPPAADPASPLQKAVMASQALAATQTQEPPSLESIEAHVEAGDPAVVNNAAEAARSREKGMLAKFFTHPLVIDSAVLGASLMVPPSLPLTLAQSRLGRSLTKRALKDSDLDKSVAGRVAQDVGNMPITRKRSKK